MSELPMNQILHGDCLEKLKELPDNSVDLVCTDPPYGYSFMGKNWDKAVPSVEIWKECLRVLKPGGFAFVMSAPRQDVLSQMIVRIGEAGFDTDFTSIYWTYASGFPKAMNIGKMVDKRNGAEPTLGELKKYPDGTTARKTANHKSYIGSTETTENTSRHETHPTSPEAKALDGSYGGFQPKPAVEVVIVAMKPLSEKTFVDQALKNGKGITWLDDCRVPYLKTENPVEFNAKRQPMQQGIASSLTPQRVFSEDGRFPANLLISDSILDTIAPCINEDFTPIADEGLNSEEDGIGEFTTRENPILQNEAEEYQNLSRGKRKQKPIGLLSQKQELPSTINEAENQREAQIETKPTENGCGQLESETETSVSSVEQQKNSILTTSNPTQNIPNLFTKSQTEESSAHPVIEKRRPTGSKNNTSQYSRYFDLDAWATNLPEEVKKVFPFLIVPKAAKSEKNSGIEESNKNIHPTVKPLKLMSYLITLGSRPGNVVLDPFTGSGTTCLAAKQLKRNYIGIEKEKEYVDIANARLNAVPNSLFA